MQKITPCLWFDTQAEEAANFYVSLFEDAEMTDVSRYPTAAPSSRQRDAGVLPARRARSSWPSTAGRSSRSPRPSRST